MGNESINYFSSNNFELFIQIVWGPKFRLGDFHW